MSQITLQGKQQALMRVAASRVAVLDSVTSVKEHASGCVRALPVSPSVLMRLGATAGAAASVLGTLAGLRRRKRLAEKKAAKSGSQSALIMVIQLLLPVLLPHIRKMLQDKVGVNGGQSMNF